MNKKRSIKKIISLILALTVLFSMSIPAFAATNSYRLTVTQGVNEQSSPAFSGTGNKLSVSAYIDGNYPSGNCTVRVYCVGPGGLNWLTPYFTITQPGVMTYGTFSVKPNTAYTYVVKVQGAMPGNMVIGVGGTDYNG